MSTFKRTAFTLIELLVVIAIIGILSGLIVVSMSGVSQKATIAKAQVFSNSLKNSIMLNLVSEWKLDGNVNDSWGINSGSVSGATTLTSGCARDNCLSFDGGNDYLLIGDNDSLDFTNNYTIEMFVYNEAGTVSYPTLLNRVAQSSNNGYFWIFTGGTDEVTIRFQYCNGTTSSEVSSFADVLPKDKWTHLVFTYDDSTKILKLYNNGNYFTFRTLTTPMPVDDGILYFGAYQLSNFFKGRLDEIRWYNAVMPAYIIKEHYYSALNRLFIEGEMPIEDYLSFVLDNKYGKY